MKKIFAVMLLTVGIIFCSQFATIENVSAKNLYVGDYDNIPLYLDTESVRIISREPLEFSFTIIPEHLLSTSLYIKRFDSANFEYNFVGVDFGYIHLSNYKTYYKEVPQIVLKVYKHFMDNFDYYVRLNEEKEERKSRERAERRAEIERLAEDEARREEAHRNFEEAERRREEKANKLLIKGKSFYKEKNFVEAIDCFNEVIKLDTTELDPGHILGKYAQNAYFYRGLAYYYLKNYDQAIKDYTEVIENYSATYKEMADAYNNRGLAYYYLKNYDQAIKDYTRAINFNSIDFNFDLNDGVEYNNRGLAYYDLKNYDKAIEDFTQAIKLNPNYANAYINRGNSYHVLENYDKAIDDYKTALSKGNKDADKKIWDIYCESKKFDEAVQYYTQKVKENKKDATSYFRLAYSYAELKDYKNAVKNYEQAIKLNPSLTEVYNNRGQCYKELKNYKSAAADFEKAAEFNPTADAYYNCGNLYEELKNYNKALECYKKTIELAQKSEEITSNVTELLLTEEIIKTNDDGNGSSSVIENNMIIEVYDKNYRGRLGRVYFYQKNYSEALKYFDDAINKFGSIGFGDMDKESYWQGDNNIFWLRGQCNENLKNYDAALADYKEAFKLEENNKKISDSIKRMEKILNK